MFHLKWFEPIQIWRQFTSFFEGLPSSEGVSQKGSEYIVIFLDSASSTVSVEDAEREAEQLRLEMKRRKEKS